MKHLFKLPAIVLGLMLLLTGTPQRLMAQDEDISLQTFYDELSPYGEWIEDSNYGYVWRPDVDQNDFRPYYTNGRWAMTEYGNTWVSNYDWGWAPFHYGRWVTDRYNEWVWIPDTTWGPAWVNWRSGGGYYGWAPLGPSMNVNINIGGGGGFSIPDFWWSFIPQQNIYYDNFPRYYSNRNYGIIHNTTIINNVYVNNRHSYYAGPRREDIRRATRQDVRVYNINRSTRPGRSGFSNNNVNFYRPTGGRGSSNNNNGGKPVPRRVISGDSYTARGSNVNKNNTTTQGRGGRESQGNAVRGNAPDRAGGRTQRTENTGTVRTPSTTSDRQSQRQGRQGSDRSQTTPADQQKQQQAREARQAQQTDQQRQSRQRTDQTQQADQQRQQARQTQQVREGRQSRPVDEQRQQQAQQQQARQSQQADQQRQQQAQQQQARQSQQADQQRQQQAQQQQARQNQQAEQQRQQQAQQQQARQSQQADQQRQQQAQQQQRQQQTESRSSENSGGGRSGRSGRN